MPSDQLEGGEEMGEGGLLRSIVCCAPKAFNGGDEDDLLRSDDGRGRDITYDQPQRVAQPSFDSSRARPATSRSASTHFSQWYDSGRAGVSKARRPWTSHSHTKGRPKIGAPTDFRRLSDTPRRRQEFRPLELSIYMPGRALSPLPDFTLDEWTLPTGLKKPAPALVTDMELPRNLVHSYTDSAMSTRSYSVRRKPLSIVGDADGHRRYDSYASANTSILDEGPVPGIIDHILQDLPTETTLSMIQPLPAARQVDSRHSGRSRASSVMADEIGSMSSQRPRSRSSTQSSSCSSDL